MAELIQVRKKSQITLPLTLRKKLGIEEGDFLEFNDKDGEIVLKVKKLIDKDQVWFWTKRWQEAEKEVEEDKKAGRVYSFPDAKSAIASLHEYAKEVKESRNAKARKS